MFQNLESDTIKMSKQSQQIKEKRSRILNNIFTKKYIFIYLISFMISMVSLGGGLSAFSLSFLAACFSNSVPLLGVVILSIIGNLVGFGVDGAVSYILTVLLMIASLYIIKPKYNEEGRNEKIQISKNLFIATLLIQLLSGFLTVFTTYDVLFSITFSILAVVFYKIFVNGLVLLEDIKEKRAFSIEEVIGTSLLLAIAVSSFGENQILGFSIRNVFSILIVLILRMEKWNINRNNIRCCNRCNYWCNNWRRANNNCSICTISA